MGCWRNNPWWLRLTCFFFFGGLSCFVPFLAAHLKWLGLTLMEIAAINLISSVLSALGLLVAANYTPRCGHRSNLAISILLATFCAGGLLLVPRIKDRSPGFQREDRATTEILCRPEGSMLFFRQCGTSCELDTTIRTELIVSDCRFEARSQIPVKNWSNWMSQGWVPHLTIDDNSEPERGDLPQKVAPPVPEGNQPIEYESDESGEDSGSHKHWAQESARLNPIEPDDANNGENNPESSIDPYESYDYDREHPDQDYDQARTKRHNGPRNEYDAGIDLTEEESNLSGPSSPHICFSSHSTATTCHVFIGTNHTFRFNTSFYSGKKEDGLCFYMLSYDDVDQHILSELSCRSNKPDNQVRCRAEGVNLRNSISQNGTAEGACAPPPDRFHLTFWLYLVFRTLGEMAVIAAAILLLIVALTEEEECQMFRNGPDQFQQHQNSAREQLCSEEESEPKNLTKESTISYCWWIYGLAGLVLFGPIAGMVNQVSGFGVGFLLGGSLFGMAAFTIAISPSRSADPQLRSIMSSHLISTKDLSEILSNKKSLAILMLILFYGMAAAVVNTTFYWYLVSLKAPYVLLGTALASNILLVPVIFLLKSWLLRTCGHNYIFITGLLVYSIRFLGHSLISKPQYLITVEMLEPLCSSWMLLTGATRVEQMEARKQMARRVNIWALIILSHYSFGRALGGLFSAMAGHHFQVTNVFVGSAVICISAASFWLLLLHAVIRPQNKFRLFGQTTRAMQIPTSNHTLNRGY